MPNSGGSPRWGKAATAAAGLAGGVAQLNPTAEEQRQAREALLKLLARETDSLAARELVGAVAQLQPTVHDLSECRAWAIPATIELLAAVRKNSTLPAWLGWLPGLV